MGRAVPAGGRAVGRPVRGPSPSPPPRGRAGPGAGPGGASSALAPCQFSCSDLLRPPRPRPATCGLSGPRSPASRAAAAAAATAARRAPPAAPAPCPPAARARPPNPRGGRRRCYPYYCSASSGRRDPDQEPVSTRLSAPPFPPGRRACALGAAAGGRGRRRHLDGPGTKEGAPRTALGASSPAGRTTLQFPGPRVQLPCLRPSYLGRRAKDARSGPQRLGGRGLGPSAYRDLAGARDSVRGLGAAVTAGHRSRAGAHAVGALGAGLERAPLPKEG